MVSWKNAVQEEHCKCLCNQNNSGAWFTWHVLIVAEGMWYKTTVQKCVAFQMMKDGDVYYFSP